MIYMEKKYFVTEQFVVLHPSSENNFLNRFQKILIVLNLIICFVLFARFLKQKKPERMLR